MKLRRIYPKTCYDIESGTLFSHKDMLGTGIVVRALEDGEKILGSDQKPIRVSNKIKNKYFCRVLEFMDHQDIVVCFDCCIGNNVKFYRLVCP